MTTPERVYRGVAALDLVVTAAFAVPAVGRPLVRRLVALESVSRAHRGGCSYVDLETSPFMPVMGLIGVAWAAHRLLRPTPLAAAVDATARVLVARQLAGSVRAGRLPASFAAFVLTELAGAVVQVAAVRAAAVADGARP